MKKVCITLLLVCTMAGLAFAQLTFTGDVYVGFEFLKVFDQEEQITMTPRSESASMFNLGANLTRENYGAKMDLSFVASDNPMSLKRIYGWADFLDNSLRLSVGNSIDAAWVTNLDPDTERFFDEINGFRLNYRTPLTGLSVGVAFRGWDSRRGTPMNITQMGQRIIFGANYIHPMFNAVGAYDMGGNAGFQLGVNYTGMDNLTSAGIQIRAERIASWDHPNDFGQLELFQKVGYRIIRPLTVSLLTGQLIYGTDQREIELSFTPSVSYRIMPGLTASLAGSLRIENNYNLTAFPDDKTFMLYSVTPSIEYALRGPAVLYAEYELNIGKYYSQSYNRFGFGIEIKAF